MRFPDKKEMKQRGCIWCKDRKKVKGFCGKTIACVHDKCPYHELDRFNSYRQFIKSKEK
jgi:hypothetical protein